MNPTGITLVTPTYSVRSSVLGGRAWPRWARQRRRAVGGAPQVRLRRREPVSQAVDVLSRRERGGWVTQDPVSGSGRGPRRLPTTAAACEGVRPDGL